MPCTDNSQLVRKGIHAIFIDFRKAPDLVNHCILLGKLASMNVSKPFWLWIRSFLTGKHNKLTYMHGILSSIQPCPLGIPQGSVISPTLFNVHNDLENTVPNLVNINTCKQTTGPSIRLLLGVCPYVQLHARSS